MSFVNQYSTIKSEQEEKTEFKNNLTFLVRAALEKTTAERIKENENGLILTNQEIEQIMVKVNALEFDNGKAGAMTLEGVIRKALRNSEEPEIKSLLSKQAKIYSEKQSAFKKSEEYEVAQKIYKEHPNLIEKVMDALNIGLIEEEKDGKIEIYCKGDETRFISNKNDNALIKFMNGKTTIRVSKNNENEKSLSE